jgi:hypothetical protein
MVTSLIRRMPDYRMTTKRSRAASPYAWSDPAPTAAEATRCPREAAEPPVPVLVARSRRLLRRAGRRASSRCRGRARVTVSISAARSCTLCVAPSSSDRTVKRGKGLILHGNAGLARRAHSPKVPSEKPGIAHDLFWLTR